MRKAVLLFTAVFWSSSCLTVECRSKFFLVETKDEDDDDYIPHDGDDYREDDDGKKLNKLGLSCAKFNLS